MKLFKDKKTKKYRYCPKYTLCVYYLFTKKEEIQIGDSDYIKYDNQYYFVGQDITDCIIKKIDDYILVK